MTESSKVKQLAPFKECKKCGSVCSLEVANCPKCFCPYFNDLTVKELKAKADANGKIRAFCMELPKWPFREAWQIVDARKKGELEDLS